MLADAEWTHRAAVPVHSIDGMKLGLAEPHRDFVYDQMLARKPCVASKEGLRFASQCRPLPELPDLQKDFGDDAGFDYTKYRLRLREDDGLVSISSENAAQILNPSLRILGQRKAPVDSGGRTRDTISSAAGQLLDKLQASLGGLATSENGLHAGLINLSRENYYGTQVGLVNAANEWHGLQIGLVNRSRRGTGLQIGLINFADAKTEIVSPIVFSARF